MRAKALYSKLDKDFGIESLKDDWSFMSFNDYITPEFKRSYMGLVLDNADKVKKVYTATMPDLDILEKLILTNQTDILLFSHHAMGYDPAIPGIPFYDIPKDYLKKLKQKRISFYVLYFFTHHLGANLTPAQEETILNTYKLESVEKKTLLFRQGDANTRHYIIEKGLLRLYLIDPKGKEINILFAKENQIIGDLATPEPTNFYLETTEDSIVYSIDELGLQQLLGDLNTGKTLNRNHGLRRSYIHIQQRLVSIISKTAEENYIEFKQKYPDLIQRLPQYHIAAYLGISPEFLSKIIAKTTKKK